MCQLNSAKNSTVYEIEVVRSLKIHVRKSWKYEKSGSVGLLLGTRNSVVQKG